MKFEEYQSSIVEFLHSTAPLNKNKTMKQVWIGLQTLLLGFMENSSGRSKNRSAGFTLYSQTDLLANEEGMIDTFMVVQKYLHQDKHNMQTATHND